MKKEPKKLKWYPQIPKDLFDYLIEKYHGVITGEIYTKYAVVKMYGKPVLMIYYAAQYGYEFRALTVYNYEIDVFEIAEKGMQSIDEKQLEKYRLITIGSKRGLGENRLFTLANLIVTEYEPQKSSLDHKIYGDRISKGINALVRKKTEKMLTSKMYGVLTYDGTFNEGNDAHDSKYCEKSFGRADHMKIWLKFVKEIETNHTEYITFKEFREKFANGKESKIGRSRSV